MLPMLFLGLNLLEAFFFSVEKEKNMDHLIFLLLKSFSNYYYYYFKFFYLFFIRGR